MAFVRNCQSAYGKLRGFNTSLLQSLAISSAQATESAQVAAHGSDVFEDMPRLTNKGYSPAIIHAIPREKAGTINSKKTRKIGRVPSVLLGLPGNSIRLVSLEKVEIDNLIRVFRPSGLKSRLSVLEIEEEDGSKAEYPVLAKQIHKTATTNELENIVWLWTPPGREVIVDIPVRLTGEDICPAVKKGGYVKVIRWKVTCKCTVPFVPSHFEADVSGLTMGKRIWLNQFAEELRPYGAYIVEKENYEICNWHQAFKKHWRVCKDINPESLSSL